MQCLGQIISLSSTESHNRRVACNKEMEVIFAPITVGIITQGSRFIKVYTYCVSCRLINASVHWGDWERGSMVQVTIFYEKKEMETFWLSFSNTYFVTFLPSFIILLMCKEWFAPTNMYCSKSSIGSNRYSLSMTSWAFKKKNNYKYPLEWKGSRKNWISCLETNGFLLLCLWASCHHPNLLEFRLLYIPQNPGQMLPIAKLWKWCYRLENNL